MKMKTPALILGLCLLSALPTSAQHITRVGVCDFARVLGTAYKESKAYRDYDAARTDYAQEIASTTREVTSLENQKIDADTTGDKSLSLSLEKKIADKRAYLENYRRVKLSILEQQRERLLSGAMVREILDAVNYVAETGGFSLVLRSDGDLGAGIIYRIAEVEITDMVIKELLRRAGKR